MVYFVGAGTGAEDLITVRGMRLSEKADVVIYAGSLVNPGLLKMTGEGCEIHNSAVMTLEEVIKVMKTAHQAGKTVVRLHTGDPSIYGAVREQMDELDELQIPYESCPGVSACFGAAASLNLEYTLPGISQSLIITRMEGRTEVPEGESIESFAAHHASMAIYLSSNMTGELSRRLITGGYTENTPAAIVYKATWPEEKKLLCTLSTLEKTALENGITKTALIIVGDAVKNSGYSRSKLYDPSFDTEFRKAKVERKPLSTSEFKSAEADKGYKVERNPLSTSEFKSAEADMRYKKDNMPGIHPERLSVIFFTEGGRKLAFRIREELKGEGEISLYGKSENWEKQWIDKVQICRESLSLWTARQFEQGNPILFIGACGIAVRAIAPHLKNKLRDIPVLAADEAGQFVIPVLAGHYGGANELAFLLEERLGMKAVITAATDVNHVFAADVFARRNGLAISDKEGIKKISSAILAGERPEIYIEGSFQGKVPEELTLMEQKPCSDSGPVSIFVSPCKPEDFRPVLHLIPRVLAVGIGCRRGKTYQELEEMVNYQLERLGACRESVACLATIEMKKDEAGLCELAGQNGWKLMTFTKDELMEVPGSFTASDFVAETAGVDNVCERAAAAVWKEQSCLLLAKQAHNGITVAVAAKKWSVSFDE